MTMPTQLDFSESTFVPPEADKYVEVVLGYWQYAYEMADKEHVLAPPYFPATVDEAERILREQYPQVAAAVDRVIIARSLARNHD